MAAIEDDFGVVICGDIEHKWCGSEFMTPVSYQAYLGCLPNAFCDAVAAKFAIGIRKFFLMRADVGIPPPGLTLPIEIPAVVRFSPQHLYDCVPRVKLSMAFEDCAEYVRTNGLHTLEKYPMTEYRYQCTCKSDTIVARKMTVDGYRWIDGVEAALDVLKEEPIIGCIRYRSIVEVPSSDPSYVVGVNDVSDPSSLGHAMLIIGFGYDDVGLYLVVKNCLGLHWGFRGYMKFRPAVFDDYWCLGSLRWMEL